MWKLAFLLLYGVHARDFLLRHAPVAAQAEECAGLNLTTLTIKGHDFGPIANLMCETWPGAFGRFPISDALEMSSLLSNLFTGQGVWDTLKASFNTPNETYCLRESVQRLKLAPAAVACPVVVDPPLLEEIGETLYDTQLDDGFWSCKEGGTNDCQCDRRDTPGEQLAPVMIKRRPKGCKMVHRGECFGKCPFGYRPTFFTGWFRPVCTNICAETDHPFACGVGCAVSRGACFQIIFRQIISVVTSVSKVVSLFIKGANAVTIAAQAVRVAEFALQVVLKAVAVAEKIYETVSREKVGLTMVTAVFQLLREEAQELPKIWEELRGIFSATGEFFLQLVDAEYGWQKVNLNWISGVLTRGSNVTLSAAHDLVKEFAYGRCRLSNNEVAFSVEDPGDERVAGPWQISGRRNRRLRYVLTANKTKTRVDTNRKGTWTMWFLDRSFGRGWWFGWLGLGWRRLYENKAQTDTVPTIGWTHKEGKLPLPTIVIPVDGGESDQ